MQHCLHLEVLHKVIYKSVNVKFLCQNILYCFTELAQKDNIVGNDYSELPLSPRVRICFGEM